MGLQILFYYMISLLVLFANFYVHKYVMSSSKGNQKANKAEWEYLIVTCHLHAVSCLHLQKLSSRECVSFVWHVQFERVICTGLHCQILCISEWPVLLFAAGACSLKSTLKKVFKTCLLSSKSFILWVHKRKSGHTLTPKHQGGSIWPASQCILVFPCV